MALFPQFQYSDVLEIDKKMRRLLFFRLKIKQNNEQLWVDQYIATQLMRVRNAVKQPTHF